MSKDGLQLFELQGRRNAEHALVAVETTIRHEDVGLRIVSQEIAEGLHDDDGAGDGIVFRNCTLEKDLQGCPDATTQIGKKFPVEEEVTAEDFGNAEYEMTVRNLLEEIRAEPFSELRDQSVSSNGGGIQTPGRRNGGMHLLPSPVTFAR
ncbi:MAG: hypothetical protein JXL20_07820 [Deltaproteobacteria bacterium]|nr:hypothetical protein [Deltaproteobacteria bacterium]